MRCLWRSSEQREPTGWRNPCQTPQWKAAGGNQGQSHHSTEPGQMKKKHRHIIINNNNMHLLKSLWGFNWSFQKLVLKILPVNKPESHYMCPGTGITIIFHMGKLHFYQQHNRDAEWAEWLDSISEVWMDSRPKNSTKLYPLLSHVRPVGCYGRLCQQILAGRRSNGFRVNDAKFHNYFAKSVSVTT